MASSSRSTVVTILDDRSPNVTITEGWGFNGVNQEYNITTSSSGTFGSTLTVNFEGVAIEVYGTLGYGSSSSQSYAVDGKTLANFTAPIQITPQFHTKLFSDSNLSAGPHTLVITQETTQTSWNTGNLFIDYFLVTSPPLPPTTDNTYYDDADGFVDYQGDWVDNLGTVLDFETTLHTAMSSGAYATFNFTGTGVSVYGSLAQSVTNQDFATFSIDGEAPVAPNWHDSDPPWLDGVLANHPLYTITLNPGSHSLVMTALQGDALALDYFTVLGGESTTRFNVTDIVTVSSSLSSGIPANAASTSSSSTSSSSTSSSTSSKAGPPSANIGAIVGGVVGGICVLTSLVLALLILRQRRRRREANEQFARPLDETHPPDIQFSTTPTGQPALPALSPQRRPSARDGPTRGEAFGDPSSSTDHNHFYQHHQSNTPSVTADVALPFLSPQRRPSHGRPPLPPLDSAIIHITDPSAFPPPPLSAPSPTLSHSDSQTQSPTGSQQVLLHSARSDAGSLQEHGGFTSRSRHGNNGDSDSPITPLSPRPLGPRRKSSRDAAQASTSVRRPVQHEDSGIRYIPSIVTEDIPPEYTPD